MNDRERFSSGAPWEAKFGYSRLVRAGRQAWIAGTTAVDASGAVLHPGDAQAQTEAIFDKFRDALSKCGGELRHVVRTRVFLIDLADFDAVARAHGEAFGEIRPASTLVQVAGLIDPAMRVEIEADALLDEG